MISVVGPTSTTPCLTRYAPSAPLADPVAGSSSTPTGQANIRVCTVDCSSTVTVVNSMRPWALCCSQTLLSSSMLGLAFDTAVRVRTGTIITGNPVEMTYTGRPVPVISGLGTEAGVATAKRSRDGSPNPGNIGLGRV